MKYLKKNLFNKTFFSDLNFFFFKYYINQFLQFEKASDIGMYEHPFKFVQLQLFILCALVEPANLPVSGHIGQYQIFNKLLARK